MKTKCNTLILTIWLFTVSFICLTIFFILYKIYSYDLFEYFYNIFLGLFGSSFVVFIIAITEYRVAKTQLLEKIWNESNILTKQLYKIQPLVYNIDRELIENYINEIVFNNSFKGIPKPEKRHDAYDKIFSYYEKYYIKDIENLSKNERKKFIDSIIKQKEKEIINDLNIAIDQYLNLNNYSFINFNNLLGDVKFFSGKRYYDELLLNIYKPLYDIYDELKEKVCYHLRLYKDGETNRPDVLLNIILNNQKKLFKVRKKTVKKHRCNFIFNYFCDIMNDKIEEFRSNVIYGCDKDNIEHVPVSINYYENIKI